MSIEKGKTSLARAIGVVVVLVGALVGAAFYASLLNQDANADLKQYHLYNAFLFLRGRWHIDFAASGMHTFFNPLLDVPYFLAATNWFPNSPATVAAFQGLYFGALIFAAFLVNLTIFRNASWGFVIAVVAAVLGASGATTLSEVGSVFNDIPIAALVLFSLAMLLPLYFKDGQYLLPAGLGGVLMGVAGAFKLTGVIYAPAAVIALLVTMRPPRQSLKVAMFFCCGWGVGFCLIYGWWGYAVWQKTGNPFFPFLNNIFKSDWYPPLARQPYGLAPTSIFQGVFAPFYWVVAQLKLVTEGTLLRDARPALAYALVILFVVAAAMKRRWPRIAEISPSPVGWFIVVFAAISYALWLKFYFALRLGLILETLSGTIIMMAVVQATRILLTRDISRMIAVVGCGAVLIGWLYLWSIIPQFGRVHFGSQTISISVPPIPSGSLVLVPAQTSYLVPFISGDFRAIGITRDVVRGYRWYNQIATILGDAGDNVFLLNGPAGVNDKIIHDLGLTWTETDCRPITSNLWVQERICKLHRIVLLN